MAPVDPADDFPVLGPSGEESQTLNRMGKELKKSSTAPPHPLVLVLRHKYLQTPSETLFHQFPDFFENVQQVSAGIQKEAFDKWQCKQRELFVDLSQNMAALTLNTLTEIQQRELVRISEESNSLVKGKLEEVEAIKKSCRDDVNYIKDEMRELREDLEAMNMKFHRAFGVVMKRWDGSRVSCYGTVEAERTSRRTLEGVRLSLLHHLCRLQSRILLRCKFGVILHRIHIMRPFEGLICM